MSSSCTLTPSSVRSFASIGTSASLKCSASELQYGDDMTVMIVFGATRGVGEGAGRTTARMAVSRFNRSMSGFYPLFVRPVILERLAARRVTKLAERLRLDLANSLPRHAELLADLFERSLVAVFESEAQYEYFTFALGQVLQNVLHLLFEQHHGGRLGRGDRLLILDEVAEVRVFLLADRRFERDRLLRDLHDL